MKRTISVMVGKGSVNHNSRKFKAENVDGNRTHLNIDYCNENIKKVYFRLLRKVFGSQQIEALVSQAKEQEQQRKHTKQPSNQRTKRIRNNDFER